MEKLGLRFEKKAHYYDMDVLQYRIHRDDFRWDGSAYSVLPDENS
jgi:hypothetical protein